MSTSAWNKYKAAGCLWCLVAPVSWSGRLFAQAQLLGGDWPFHYCGERALGVEGGQFTVDKHDHHCHCLSSLHTSTLSSKEKKRVKEGWLDMTIRETEPRRKSCLALQHSHYGSLLCIQIRFYFFLINSLILKVGFALVGGGSKQSERVHLLPIIKWWIHHICNMHIVVCSLSASHSCQIKLSSKQLKNVHTRTDWLPAWWMIYDLWA